MRKQQAGRRMRMTKVERLNLAMVRALEPDMLPPLALMAAWDQECLPTRDWRLRNKLWRFGWDAWRDLNNRRMRDIFAFVDHYESFFESGEKWIAAGWKGHHRIMDAAGEMFLGPKEHTHRDYSWATEPGLYMAWDLAVPVLRWLRMLNCAEAPPPPLTQEEAAATLSLNCALPLLGTHPDERVRKWSISRLPLRATSS